MTEQQTNDFALWFEQFMDPELNLTPGDKELCQHAWQAALSHAERREFQTEQDLISFLDGLYETAGPDSSALTGQKWVAAQRAIEGIRSHAEGEAVTFMRTWKSEPIYTCNKPGDMSGTYYPAPQVAVPEPVGWVKWFDGEASFQPRDAILPEDAKQHGWQLVGLMRSLNAPTAPAGNRYSPSATAAMQGLSALRSAVHCGGPWDNAMDDAYETVKAFIGKQPVSDPDGFEQVLEELRKLHTEMTNTDLVHEGGPEIVGYCVTGKQLDRMEWLLTCCASAALSAPAPDEREIAAKALDDFMFDVAERVRLLSDSDQEARVLRKVNGWLHSRAKRLRAGKEGQ